MKKFGLTKFCSVRQNLEFCQTDVRQNSRVFRQHCKMYNDQNQNARGVANVAENESIWKMATKNFLKGIAEEF